MIKRFLEFEKPLKSILASPPNNLKALKLTDLNLTPREWELLEELSKLFGIYKPIVEKLSGHSYPTLAGVLPAYMKLESELMRKFEEHKGNVRDLLLVKGIEAAIAKLQKYFHKAKASEYAVIATILNPYFRFSKLQGMGWSSAELKEHRALFLEIFQLYNNSYGTPKVDEGSSDSFVSDDEVYFGVNEVTLSPPPQQGRVLNAAEQYLDSTPLKKHKCNSKNDISYKTFWKYHESHVLARMARDFGIILATSIPSESVFSIAGLIITKRRGRISPATMEVIMCLKSWGLLDDMLISAAEVEEDDIVEVKIDQQLEEKDMLLEQEGYDMTRKGDADIIIV